MYTFLCNLIATAPIFPAGSCSPFNLVRWSLIEQVSLSHAPHFLLLTSQHCPLHAPVPASHFECVVLLYVFRSLSLTRFYFRCFLTDFNSHDLNQPWLAMFDCRGCTVPMTLTLKVYSTQHLPANTSECSLLTFFSCPDKCLLQIVIFCATPTDFPSSGITMPHMRFGLTRHLAQYHHQLTTFRTA